MAVRIQFRRGTKTEWEGINPILAQGELGYESTDKKIKFGDGVTDWNNLPVAAAGDITTIIVSPGSGLRYGTQTDGYGTANAGTSGNVQLELDTSVVVSPTSFNAKGDLLVGTADNSFAVLPVSTTNGQALVANSSASSGVSWSTISNPTITAGYITNTMLAADSVTADKIAANAVTDSELASNSVTNTKIAATAVDGTKIADASITAAKLATNAVETAKINSLAVTTDKIAASAVTAAKVGTDVYQRGGTGFTPASARIFIQSTTPTGTAGDIWFKY